MVHTPVTAAPLPTKAVVVTLAFWVMKILATTLGETAGDYLSMTLQLGYYASLIITFTALAMLLLAQISLKTLHPLLFWLTVVGTTTAGTEISDFMDRSLGLGYVAGSAILACGLMAVLGVWWARVKDLRVDHIAGKEAELMFWLAVLLSNSLGTAFGDFLVDNMGLTFLQGALVTASVIAIVALLHVVKATNDVALFWLAFIFTRPFGATFGDFLTKPFESGGLHLPREGASLASALLLLGVLGVSEYLKNRRKA